MEIWSKMCSSPLQTQEFKTGSKYCYLWIGGNVPEIDEVL